MRRKQTPRTDLISSILINIGCVLLLVNAVNSQSDNTIVVLIDRKSVV